MILMYCNCTYYLLLHYYTIIILLFASYNSIAQYISYKLSYTRSTIQQYEGFAFRT